VPGYAVNDMFDHVLHWHRHLCLKRQLNANHLCLCLVTMSFGGWWWMLVLLDLPSLTMSSCLTGWWGCAGLLLVAVMLCWQAAGAVAVNAGYSARH